MDKHEPEETEWKWRYSLWTGVMYGPIPVGLIVVVGLTVGFIVYRVITHRY